MQPEAPPKLDVERLKASCRHLAEQLRVERERTAPVADRVFRRLEEWTDRDRALQWLSTPHEDFGNRPPIALMMAGDTGLLEDWLDDLYPGPGGKREPGSPVR
jgi:uncharacterized protein (DUF2384 family)